MTDPDRTPTGGPAGERPAMAGTSEEEPTVVFRDKRRIDPATGQVRAPEASRSPGAPVDPAASGLGPARGASSEGAGDTSGGPSGHTSGDAARVAELTEALQRERADYANYRKRVERDRALVAEQALASVLAGLLPVLDDIGRARAHGPLEGGFKAVAESLETTTVRLGLVPFGEPGDPFDPTIHEALQHGYDDSLAGPTCTAVLQPGYRIGERLVRPARVAVAEPAPGDVREVADADGPEPAGNAAAPAAGADPAAEAS